MKAVGVIDSICFRTSKVEALFNNDENYNIQTVKSIGIYEKSLWLQTFGKNLPNNIIEAKIIHTIEGLNIPLKRYARTPKYQMIEFAGLYGYNEASQFLQKELRKFMELSLLSDEVTEISRIDIALDFESKEKYNQVIRAIKQKKERVPFKVLNSTYLKTDKEGKKNYRINIVAYPKHIKDSLDFKVYRIEFSFGSMYFRKKHTIQELQKVYEKVAKTIKRFTGLEVGIKAV